MHVDTFLNEISWDFSWGTSLDNAVFSLAAECLRKCKEMILVKAKVALAERPNVKRELLEEVLLVR